MEDLVQLINKIIPPSTREHRDGFSNEQYIDALDDNEKKSVAAALIDKLRMEKDNLIIETLAYLKSEKAVPVLKDILNKSTDPLEKIITASSIYEIKKDSSLISIAVMELSKLEENKAYYMYTLPSAFYYIRKFEDPGANAAIGKYTTHKEYLIAYNAKRYLGLEGMGKQHQQTKTQPAQQGDKRKIDLYFDRLDASHENPANRVLHYLFVPLMVLGILGMAWAIPFPHIGFIGKYNGYFNWASFIIAFAIYYYLKMSPLLSYFALFLLFGLSYVVMQLEAYAKTGGTELSVISVGILLVSLAGQFIGGKIEGNEQTFSDDTRLAYVTPLWVIYKLAQKIGLKY